MRLKKDICKSCLKAHGFTWNRAIEFLWKRHEIACVSHNSFIFTGTMPSLCEYSAEHIVAKDDDAKS